MVIKLLSGFRFVSLIAVVSSFIGSLLMFYVGAAKIFKAVWAYFGDPQDLITTSLQAEAIAHLTAADLAIGLSIESLDAFLVALVLMYFGFGIYSLLMTKNEEAVELGMPLWLLPKNLGQLKETLTHVIIVVLFVLFTRTVWLNLHNLRWELLIIPASIALLGLGLKFLDISGEKHGE